MEDFNRQGELESFLLRQPFSWSIQSRRARYLFSAWSLASRKPLGRQTDSPVAGIFYFFIFWLSTSLK